MLFCSKHIIHAGKAMKAQITVWPLILLTMSCASSPPCYVKSDVDPTSTNFSSLEALPSYNPSKVIESDYQGSAGIPETIRLPPRHNVYLAQVVNNSNTYIGKQVRWGGIIHSLQNEKGSTLIRVIAYELDDSGRPKTNTHSLGSFLARASIPFNTTTYAQDREITVVGIVTSLTQRVVAEKLITLPLIKAENIYMWGKSAAQDQNTVSLLQYSPNSRCHYVYEGRCQRYTPRYSRLWYSSSHYVYKDLWYRYRPRRYNRHWDSWYEYRWPRSYIHFGFYSD